MEPHSGRKPPIIEGGVRSLLSFPALMAAVGPTCRGFIFLATAQTAFDELLYWDI